MELKKYKKKRIIPKGWKEISIGDVFRTSSGATPLTTEKEYYEGGDIPWVNSGELISPFVYKTSNHITQKGYENSSTEVYPINTVLVAMYGATAGKVSMLKIEACTNQAICAILPNVKFCPEFIKYSLDSLYEYLVGLSSGSARDNLSQAGLKKLKLVLPKTKREQNELISILSLLDRKIELNKQINDNLEAMAKQLYDYWFVQFDFPNEEGKPYKSSGGDMVWNEKLKREIPQGWSDCKLKDFINLFDSKRVPLSSKDRGERQGVYPYYGATGIMDYVNDYIFDGDYILLAEDGSTSDAKGFPIVQYIWGKNWVNNHAHIILPKNERYMMFTYQMLRSIPAKQIETGSIQKKISQENLCGYKMVLPNSDLLEKYENVVSPLWEKRKRCIEEINALTKQRDELLPLLMNGQASVNYHLSDD